MSIFSRLTSSFIFSLSLISPLAASDVYFATPNGALFDPECTQSEPCHIISAIGKAVNTDVIFLGEGNYTSGMASVFTINKNITLIGGWDGTTTLPVVYDSKRFVSVIDGQSERRGIIIEPQKNVRLESLTIANTHSDDNGSGIYDFNASSLTLNDVTFYHNITATSIPSTSLYGGGLFISEGILDIKDTTFKYNIVKATISGKGGAIAAYNTEVNISNSMFNNNSSWHGSTIYLQSEDKPFILTDSELTHNGHSLYLDNTHSSAGYGILYVVGGESHIQNCLFQDNISINKNILYFSRGSLFFKNNIVSSNKSVRESGLSTSRLDSMWVVNNIFNDNNTTNADSSVVKFASSESVNDQIFANNTLANNSSTYLLNLNNSSLAAANNIFANGDTGIYVDGTSELDIYNSLWFSIQTQIDGDGTISITDDFVGTPHFVNETLKDYHIRASSAAINKGLCINMSPDDIDGDIRNENELCDIGADEYVPSGLTPSIITYLLN